MKVCLEYDVPPITRDADVDQAVRSGMTRLV